MIASGRVVRTARRSTPSAENWQTEASLARVLANGPGMGVIIHAHAGYGRARQVVDECGMHIPMEAE